MADSAGRFKMLAVDQRPPIESLVRDARGTDQADFDDVRSVKQMLIDELAEEATAVLVDPQYLFPAVNDSVPSDAGLLITLEYDHFEETPQGRRSQAIPDWTVGKIKMAGGDAVKLLAWYRPDAGPDVLEHQQAFVADVGRRCSQNDIPFVFELLVYPMPDDDGQTLDYVEHPAKRSEHVVESVETFADSQFMVDVFKLETPVPGASLADAHRDDPERIGRAFTELDRAAGRPWVILSAGTNPATFTQIASLAYEAGASGYLAGRAIWWDSCVRNFPDTESMVSGLRQTAVPYMRQLNSLTDRLARPWFEHPTYGSAGPVAPDVGEEFRRSYPENFK